MNFKFDQKKITLGLELPLMEAFYTIQGEGFHKGSAAYFIRIGGCDVGCHWCDVKESWNPLIHPATEISKISSDAKQKSDIIVITGGEPLIYNMGPLTNLLINNKMKTHYFRHYFRHFYQLSIITIMGFHFMAEYKGPFHGD